MRFRTKLDANTPPKSKIQNPKSIYLSPHFDDIALSCGGWAAAEARAGRGGWAVTIFAAPPSDPLHGYARQLHARWGEPDPQGGNALRRAEDTAALALLGLEPVWLDFADAIYRQAAYASDAALFGEVVADEWATLPLAVEEALGPVLAAVPPGTPIYVPLAAGNHVDHQITFAVGLSLWRAGWPVWFYEDYPYAARPGQVMPRVMALAAAVAPARVVPAVRDIRPHLKTKIAAIVAYPSQISSLFPSRAAIAPAVRAYATQVGALTGLAAERYWRIEG